MGSCRLLGSNYFQNRRSHGYVRRDKVRKAIQDRQLKTGPYPPSRHLSLRLSYEDGTSELITLLGWSKPQEWHIIRWQLHKNIVTPVEEYYPLGTGSNLRHQHSHIAYYATARIFLQRQWIHAENQIVLIGENPSYRIRPPLINDPLYTTTDTLLPTEPPWCAEVRAKLSRAGVVPTYLVSDASAKQVAAGCSSVFCTDTSNHTVQAGVVIAGSFFCPGRHPPAGFICVTGIPRAARSYDGELFGATCLLTLRRFLDAPSGSIQSALDCKSVIQNTGIGVTSIPKARRTQRVEPDEQLEQSCRHLHVSHQPRVVHVEAHLDAPKYNSRGNLVRGPIPRKDWSYLSHLQEVADILADPSPLPSQIDALFQRNHLPLFMHKITADELVTGAMTPGFWWWLGIDPQNTMLCAQPDLYRYLHRRQDRSIHDTPWRRSQLGLLQAMLCKHKD